ncbi:glycosyltransferase family 2 protein [Bradyrhizobium liaoningense]
MDRSTAIIVATKGRPQELRNLLNALTEQTVRPDLIVVSACDETDMIPMTSEPSNLRVLFGSPGSSAQRNRALAEVRGRFKIIVFFDDDFVPSRFWIEQAHELFAAQPDVVCATGEVLADGAVNGGLDWAEGRSIVDRLDESRKRDIINCKISNNQPPYGCNMAFRATSIEHISFDERLVLYGWLEDRDFSARAGARMVWTDALWGVHLGTMRARSSGRQFGYSQLVNPWYLVHKGTMTLREAVQTMLFAVMKNAIESIRPTSKIDRRGRLKGNIIAIKDLVLGRWAPENASNL